MAVRGRVEHFPAGDRRRRCREADDEAIAAGGDRSLAQAQLREAGGAGRKLGLTEQRDSPIEVGCSSSTCAGWPWLRPGPAGSAWRRTSRRKLAGKAPATDEGVPASNGLPLDADEARCHPLPGAGALAGAVVHLDRPDPRLDVVRREHELIAGADGARPERPGHDGADALQRKRAVDPQACGAACPVGFEPSRGVVECAHGSVRPAPVGAAVSTRGAPA